MPKYPEISPELFPEIPGKRTVTKKENFLIIGIEGPEVEKPEGVKAAERLEVGEERIFRQMSEYIDRPEIRSAKWEKYEKHAQILFESYMKRNKEGRLVPINPEKETMGVYLERHIMEKYPEQVAAIYKAMQDKFEGNGRMIVGTSAEKPDIPLSSVVEEELSRCDNILFVNHKSKLRVTKGLWQLQKQIKEKIVHKFGVKENELQKLAALRTIGIKGEDLRIEGKYLDYLGRTKSAVGFLPAFKGEKLLEPGFEASAEEIERRSEILAEYFKEAKSVRYFSKDGKTDLQVDVEDCPLVKSGAITRESQFGLLPLSGHFGLNPNSVEGKMLTNLQITKIEYNPKEFELKDHPVEISFEEGRVKEIKSQDEKGEILALRLKKILGDLATKEKEAGGNPDQVYQVVEFGMMINPEILDKFESEEINGDPKIWWEGGPHLGIAGSYDIPDGKGNWKSLKGSTLHMDLIPNHVKNKSCMEIKYKDGTKKMIMKEGKWEIFK